MWSASRLYDIARLLFEDVVVDSVLRGHFHWLVAVIILLGCGAGLQTHNLGLQVSHNLSEICYPIQQGLLLLGVLSVADVQHLY